MLYATAGYACKTDLKIKEIIVQVTPKSSHVKVTLKGGRRSHNMQSALQKLYIMTNDWARTEKGESRARCSVK